jgi:uncharacterized membrane protein
MKQPPHASAGTPPRAGASKQPGPEELWGITPRTASLLCYVPMAGWICAIVVLATERFRNNQVVRFHAFQGLYLFVAWLLIDMVLSPLLFFPGVEGFPPRRILTACLHLGVYAAWIFMIIKVAKDEMYKLPLLGELADRSVSEQRP